MILLNSYTYSIGRLNLQIIFSNKYKEVIEQRMSSFNQTKSNIINSQLIIKENELSFTINNKILYCFKNKTNIHDLYNIINNSIALLYDSNNSLYIHSCVVSDGINGVLILGDFNSGKTSVSLACKKLGLEINSADLSMIYITNNNLYLERGSRYLLFNDKKEYLPENLINKNINILNIIFCVGVCYNGDVIFDKISEKRYLIKKIYDRSSFHFKYPLLSNNQFLPSLYKNNLEFNNKIADNSNIEKFMVRGDPEQIAIKIKEMIGGK